MDDYDDFLGLSQIDFQHSSLIVFGGVSGSGKSTAMDFLRREHADFQKRPSLTIMRTERGLQPLAVHNHLVFLDEVNSLFELRMVVKLLRTNQVVIATHLPLACYLPFKAIWSIKCFRTDNDSSKIARYLGKKKVRYTAPSLRHYCQTYGANFLDVDHILERFPSDDFDRSYAMFQRLCKIRSVAH